MKASAVALCVVASMLAACGGGNERSADDQAERGRPLQKEEFLARGDAICADVQAELAPIAVRVEKARGMPPSRQMAELEEIWRRQTEIVERFRSRFAALSPPRKDRPRMDEFVRSIDDGLRLSRQIVGHLEEGEEPPDDVMQEYAQAVYRGNSLAQGYGFTVCGGTG